MRDDGSVRFLGRYKDMLKVGGENVDPTEVEAFLLQHPAISKAQVIGVPDLRLSEVACACVVVEPGQAITESDLDTFCRGKMGQFQNTAPPVGAGRIPHDLQRQGAEILATPDGRRAARFDGIAPAKLTREQRI